MKLINFTCSKPKSQRNKTIIGGIGVTFSLDILVTTLRGVLIQEFRILDGG